MTRFFLILLFIPLTAFADPLKVISLSPHTTELAFEAGLGDNLIAVSAYSDYPPKALELEQVANFRGINIERVVTLKPDLVIAWQGGNPDKELAKLERLGINVFYSNPTSLYDTADTIEALGKYSTNPEAATERAVEIRKTLSDIEATQAGKPKIRYFYQLGSTSLMTNNGESWPQPLFTLCGGENIFADSAVPYPQIGVEQVVVRKPDAIVSPLPKAETLSRWKNWQDFIPAVQNDAIFSIKGDWLNRPTPRALKAVEKICEAFDTVRSDLAH